MFKDKIYGMLTPETKRIIQEFREEPLRKVVYTSFDGDDMHHMLAICDQVLKHDMIALNPEMALGYYISTETLGGKKINVMTDCLTLTIFSDRLWVYGKIDTLLSEGIMAEIFLWSQIKIKKATFIPNIYEAQMVEMNYLEVKEWLNKMTDEKFRSDIFNSLLTPYKMETHQTVYIGANFVNYKLDQNTLAELYMLNTVYTDKAVKIVDWGDIKVPKYDKSKMWALTSKEQEEILGSNWPIEFRK